MNAAAPVTISAIIVTHNAVEEIGPTVHALAEQLRDGDELIVVDNLSADGTPDAVRAAVPGARVIETGANDGFAAACNAGAAAASGDLLVLINPDAVVAEGFRDAITRPAEDGRGWAAWQGLITRDDGRLVNSWGGVIHFIGVAWAGGDGEHVGEMPRIGDRQPGFVSGACFAIARDEYERLGGLAEEFFLYHEDVDLSLRVRLAGGRLGVERSARVEHAYQFEKGPQKWRHLERNRWATLIRTYPASLLALLAPALVMTELAILVAALTGGWFAQKLRAWGDILRALPRLLRERRELRAQRTIGVGEFAASLVAELDTQNLGAVVRSGPIAGALRAYWAVVARLLGAR